MGVYARNGSWPYDLAMMEADLFTLSPIEDGWAVVGLVEKYNPLGFVSSLAYADRTLRLDLLEADTLVLWCEHAPRSVSAPYEYHEKDHLLTIHPHHTTVVVDFAEDSYAE